MSAPITHAFSGVPSPYGTLFDQASMEDSYFVADDKILMAGGARKAGEVAEVTSASACRTHCAGTGNGYVQANGNCMCLEFPTQPPAPMVTATLPGAQLGLSSCTPIYGRVATSQTRPGFCSQTQYHLIHTDDTSAPIWTQISNPAPDAPACAAACLANPNCGRYEWIVPGAGRAPICKLTELPPKAISAGVGFRTYQSPATLEEGYRQSLVDRFPLAMGPIPSIRQGGSVSDMPVL
jgi:hypothetical protein